MLQHGAVQPLTLDGLKLKITLGWVNLMVLEAQLQLVILAFIKWEWDHLAMQALACQVDKMDGLAIIGNQGILH